MTDYIAQQKIEPVGYFVQDGMGMGFTQVGPHVPGALPLYAAPVGVGLPDGWQLVPKRVTPHMGHAGDACLDDDGNMQDMWDEMLAAAPPPPVVNSFSFEALWNAVIAKSEQELRKSPLDPDEIAKRFAAIDAAIAQQKGGV